jgi:hypothetical protein
MTRFLITFETSDHLTRQIEIDAPTVDAALSKWELIRQPGDFVESIAKPFCMEWPNE